MVVVVADRPRGSGGRRRPRRGGRPRPPRPVPEGLNFANGLFRERHYALAAEEYERFLQGAPDPADADEARYGLANARLFLGQYQEARRQFEEFLQGRPRASQRRRRRSSGWARRRTCSATWPRPAQALEAFTAAHPGHRHLDTAWPYLGDVCFGLGDLAGARRAYEQALAAHPDGRLADRARFGLGRTLAARKETDAALKVLTELAEKDNPAFADKARYQIGQVQLAAGRFAEAVAAFEALERAAPQSPLVAEARLGRAEALARLGRRDEAERAAAAPGRRRAPEPGGAGRPTPWASRRWSAAGPPRPAPPSTTP